MGGAAVEGERWRWQRRLGLLLAALAALFLLVGSDVFGVLPDEAVSRGNNLESGGPASVEPTIATVSVERDDDLDQVGDDTAVSGVAVEARDAATDALLDSGTTGGDGAIDLSLELIDAAEVVFRVDAPSGTGVTGPEAGSSEVIRTISPFADPPTIEFTITDRVKWTVSFEDRLGQALGYSADLHVGTGSTVMGSPSGADEAIVDAGATHLDVQSIEDPSLANVSCIVTNSRADATDLSVFVYDPEPFTGETADVTTEAGRVYDTRCTAWPGGSIDVYVFEDTDGTGDLTEADQLVPDDLTGTLLYEGSPPANLDGSPRADAVGTPPLRFVVPEATPVQIDLAGNADLGFLDGVNGSGLTPLLTAASDETVVHNVLVEPRDPSGGTARITVSYVVENVLGQVVPYQNVRTLNVATGETFDSNNPAGTVTFEVPVGDGTALVYAWSLTSGTVLHGGGPFDNGVAEIAVQAGDDLSFTQLAIPSARISVLAFEDELADGVKDTSDPNLALVSVSGTGETTFSGSTDATGAAVFHRLDGTDVTTYEVPPGTYTVRAGKDTYQNSDIPAGGGGTANDIPPEGATVTLAAGQTTTLRAGLYRDTTIFGVAWEDSSHEGLRQVAEGGVNDVRVEVLDAAGLPTGDFAVTETIDGQDGSYELHVRPGEYQLRFDDGPFVAINFSNGNTNSDVDPNTGLTPLFGYRSGGSIRRDAGYHPSSEVTGALVDSADGPVTDAVVTVTNPCGDREARTGEDGRFLVEVIICFTGVDANLAIVDPGGKVTATFTGFDEQDTRTIHPEEGDEFLGNISMVDPVEIHVLAYEDMDADSVLLGDGDPTLDEVTVSVTLDDPAKSFAALLTGSEAPGEAHFLVVPGGVTIRAERNGYENDDVAVDNGVGAEGTTYTFEEGSVHTVRAGLFRMGQVWVTLWTETDGNGHFDGEPDHPSHVLITPKAGTYTDSGGWQGPTVDSNGAQDVLIPVRPGVNHIELDLQDPGLAYVDPDPGSDLGSDAIASDLGDPSWAYTPEFTVTSGQAGPTQWAGFKSTAPPTPGVSIDEAATLVTDAGVTCATHLTMLDDGLLDASVDVTCDGQLRGAFAFVDILHEDTGQNCHFGVIDEFDPDSPTELHASLVDFPYSCPNGATFRWGVFLDAAEGSFWDQISGDTDWWELADEQRSAFFLREGSLCGSSCSSPSSTPSASFVLPGLVAASVLVRRRLDRHSTRRP